MIRVKIDGKANKKNDDAEYKVPRGNPVIGVVTKTCQISTLHVAVDNARHCSERHGPKCRGTGASNEKRIEDGSKKSNDYCYY